MRENIETDRYLIKVQEDSVDFDEQLSVDQEDIFIEDKIYKEEIMLEMNILVS